MTGHPYRVMASIGLTQGLTAEFLSVKTFICLQDAAEYIGEIEAAHPKSVRHRFGLTIQHQHATANGMAVWATVYASEWRHLI